VDNVEMDLGETGLSDENCLDLAQDRDRCRALLNWVLNLPVT
jgi:hypothetical protein